MLIFGGDLCNQSCGLMRSQQAAGVAYPSIDAIAQRGFLAFHRGHDRIAPMRLGALLLIALASAPGDSVVAQRAPTLLEAVQETLARDPVIIAKRQELEGHLGELVAASGAFDSKLQALVAWARDVHPLDVTERSGLLAPERSTTNVTSTQIGLVRQFRFGLAVTPSVQAVHTLGAYDPASASLVGASGSRVRVNLNLRQPLLRGRGEEATAAVEIAARISYRAAQYDLEQTIAGRVLNTVLLYWSCLGAQDSLEIAREAEARGLRLLADTEALVDGDVLPPSEREQVLASQVDKTSAKVALEERLYEARQKLGLAMGLDLDEIAQIDKVAATFPVASGALVEPTPTHPLVARAVGRRPDLLAAIERERAASVLLTAAERNLEPQLDLSADLGYSGLSEGSGFERLFAALGDTVSGPNAGLSLILELPFENHLAEGLRLQQSSLYQQLVISRRDLARTVGNDVLVSLKALGAAEAQLELSNKAAAHFAAAVESERKKLHVGISTVVDLILTEERRTAAELSRVAASEARAEAIAQVRFATGTFFASSDGELSSADLITLPGRTSTTAAGDP
jgi:outer membrane protein TolC